jgi:threonylcarbamoyladenosine tRNA methylthiotransferase MtaB
MGRRITKQKFLALVRTAQAAIKGVSITTDVIVGFPGETAQDFEETLAFIEEIGFSAGHVFSYSPRPGTPALKLIPPIEPLIKKERSRLLRAQFQRVGEQFRLQQVNHTLPVLWESSHLVSPGNWQVSGLSDTYLRVKMSATENCVGKINQICIKTVEKGILKGKNEPMLWDNAILE